MKAIVVLEGDMEMIKDLEEKGCIQVFKYSCECWDNLYINLVKVLKEENP